MRRDSYQSVGDVRLLINVATLLHRAMARLPATTLKVEVNSPFFLFFSFFLSLSIIYLFIFQGEAVAMWRLMPTRGQVSICLSSFFFFFFLLTRTNAGWAYFFTIW